MDWEGASDMLTQMSQPLPHAAARDWYCRRYGFPLDKFDGMPHVRMVEARAISLAELLAEAVAKIEQTEAQ